MLISEDQNLESSLSVNPDSKGSKSDDKLSEAQASMVPEMPGGKEDGVGAEEEEEDFIENLTRQELIELLKGQFSVRNAREAVAVVREIEEAYRILKQREAPEEDDEYDKTFSELIRRFRDHVRQKREEYFERLKKNYAAKRQIIEQLRQLASVNEISHEAIRRFRSLIRQWRETGPVPMRSRDELEQSYRFYVDRLQRLQQDFFRLVEMDRAENLRAKRELIEQLEQLMGEENPFRLRVAFHDILQEWRLYGPVPEENKDEIRDRFNHLRRELQARIRQLRAERQILEAQNEAKKEQLIARVEELAQPYQRHSDWVKATTHVRAIQAEFEQAEPVHPRRGGQLRRRMKEALDRFYEMRRHYYDQAFQESQKIAENIRQRYIQPIEQLIHQDDMRGARKTVIQLSHRFERELERAKIPRKLVRELRAQMKKVRSDFDTKWASYLAQRDLLEEENYKKKKIFLKELEQQAQQLEGDPRKLIKKAFRTWNQIGYVPLAKKKEVEEKFKEIIQSILKQMGEVADVEEFRFRISLEGLSHSELQDRRKRIIAEISSLTKEKDKIETNLEMFGNMGGGLVKDYQQRVTRLEDKIRRLQMQRQMVEELLNQ